MATVAQSMTTAFRRGLFAVRRGRRTREALQAYLFLFPGTFLLFVFNLLSVGYALWVIRGLGLLAGAWLVFEGYCSLARRFCSFAATIRPWRVLWKEGYGRR